MNQQSLQAANDFLRVASVTTAPGDFLERAPTDIGKEAGLPDPLAVARAVRALAARRRLATEDGRYRLLDATPLAPGEPESVPRTPRKRKPRRKTGSTRTEVVGGPAADRKPSYSDLGRAVVERLIELGRQAGDAVAHAEALRREAKENKAARIDAEQRASRSFERVKELEHKLEMAEANLRTVLAAARGRGATAAPSDNEMEAVLRILKGPSGEAGTDGGSAPADSMVDADVDADAQTTGGDPDPADGETEATDPVVPAEEAHGAAGE